MKNPFDNIPYIKNFDLAKMPALGQVATSARKVAQKVPFSDDIVALYFCATDPAVPAKIKLAIGAALAYLVLPVDAIPDVLPVLGFTDDAAVLTTVYSLVSSYVNEEHRSRAKAFFTDEKIGTSNEEEPPSGPGLCG